MCANKNGIRNIYKIVDLVNARDRTLITTYHEIMGQESFLVAPWEAIETVKEGTSSVSSTSTGHDSCDGEMSREGSGSSGDDESVITTVYRGRGDEGNEEMQMNGISMRRRATTDQSNEGRTRHRENFLTGGVDARRVLSEFSLMGPQYVRNRHGQAVEGFDGATSRDASVTGQKRGQDGGEGVGGGRSRSPSSASTESYQGLWGLLQGFRIMRSSEGTITDAITDESSGRSSDGKSSDGKSGGDTLVSKSSGATILEGLGGGETFVHEWRVVEKRRARDEDDLSFDCRF